MLQHPPPEFLSFLRNLTTEEKIKLNLLADTGDEAAINKLTPSSLWETVAHYDSVKDIIKEIANESNEQQSSIHNKDNHSMYLTPRQSHLLNQAGWWILLAALLIISINNYRSSHRRKKRELPAG